MNANKGPIQNPKSKNQKGSVAAIVLAAGMSQRMGSLKPLLPFGDRPMLARTIEHILAAGNISPIFVVIGHAREEITRSLSEYDLVFVPNADYAAGEMLSSVQAGAHALPSHCAAFLLVLGDQPMVQPATFRALIAAWQETGAPLVAPTYASRRGHPVLFSADICAEILALPAEETLKTVVMRHAERRIEVPVLDPAILMDVDTPEDYERALQTWRSQGGAPLT